MQNIAKLYRARWDIELLFKELKSKYALKVLETKNMQVIEAILWKAMLISLGLSKNSWQKNLFSCKKLNSSF